MQTYILYMWINISTSESEKYCYKYCFNLYFMKIFLSILYVTILNVSCHYNYIVLFGKLLLDWAIKTSTSSHIHTRNIESLSGGGTHPVLSLYNSCFQHRNTSCIQPNMKTFSLCILLSLAVAAYCVPLPQVTVQDEHFAEVCMLALPFYACMH